ncbi:MAG: hypothetical protein IJX81_01925 [Clostridia bacterium]|nr:hypothetical protein [Clostridia bacterium]
MKLNTVWGYGQLFGFSGIDGKNRYYNDFIGTLTRKKIGIRFELKEWFKVVFPVKGRISFKAITGDMIDAKTAAGEFFLAFSDSDTLVGVSPVLPEITGEKSLKTVEVHGAKVWFNSTDALALRVNQRTDGLYEFAVAHSTNVYSFAVKAAEEGLRVDMQALKKARYDYFRKLPKCKNKEYERLYYKALSVQKVNVRSAEGKFPCRWTTPDRVPHKNCWLWDSVFHALAIVTYDGELAKDAIRAVLSRAEADGFIPCMMNPENSSYNTQPQVLSWGVWEVYRKTGDKAFLAECADALEGYLEWDRKNRDKNGNGLLEWFTDPDEKKCRCGESGWDNSPRFDCDEELDAVDFSTFLAADARYLSEIFAEIGQTERSEKWRGVYERIKEQINALLWCEEDGAYYDRMLGGKLSKALTPASFFPLFAGIPTKEQAKKMVKTLTDPNLLWTATPLASIAKTHETYSTDMWRGGVWLNVNYMIIRGLRSYGYEKEAAALRSATLSMVQKWYKKTGTIFEFYDPEGQVSPLQCERKGKPLKTPDWRRHVHSIVDYNWSACFTLLMIQEEYYDYE